MDAQDTQDIRDARLEELSDKVRQGIAIDFFDAVEVVAYQNQLRIAREKQRKTVLERLKNWFRKV